MEGRGKVIFMLGSGLVRGLVTTLRWGRALIVYQDLELFRTGSGPSRLLKLPQLLALQLVFSSCEVWEWDG